MTRVVLMFSSSGLSAFLVVSGLQLVRRHAEGTHRRL